MISYIFLLGLMMEKKEHKKEETKEQRVKEDEEEITQLTPEEEVREEKGGEVRLQELEQKIKETEDRYLRACADLENYKKRAAKEREELIRVTSEKLLRELLEVKDHLELALSHSKESADVKGLREGVTLTLKQLAKFLEKFGVKEIEAAGENFNPALHEAIGEEESVEYRPGTVVRVFQKGYLFHGKLLRAARVTVAKGKEA
jgi:molecular chaperone GrpE